ncbi:LexA family transcriptional regulator [Pararhizobium sp.]|uniref:LexA family transcriptional regulator n=1 Tax=Pararhizobium sp. TaxID=1977563 RepID=UPI003D135102
MPNGGDRFSERLKIAIGDESVNAFAKRCEIPEATMRNYFKGRFPTADVALLLSDAAGVNFEWLVGDRGPMRLDRGTGLSPLEHRPLHQIGKDDPDGYTLIPRLDVSASAGNGVIVYEENALDFLAFQTDWLRARNIRAEFARILTAKGDSMMETIHDGDALLIDTSINHFKDNAIYVLIYGSMVLVKRIHARMNGTVQLISDNPRYAPEEVTAGEVDQITVAGRVMWFGRTM